jgi:hypothetical protein
VIVIKRISALFVLFSMLFLMACISNQTKSEPVLPEGIPDFVQGSDFEGIDWDNKAVAFNYNIIGNEKKSGVIGADMPSLSNQKWMWHLWGIENPTKTN